MSECDVYFKLTIHKVDWLRMHSRSVTDARRILRVLQVTNIRNYLFTPEPISGCSPRFSGGNSCAYWRRLPQNTRAVFHNPGSNSTKPYKGLQVIAVAFVIYSYLLWHSCMETSTDDLSGSLKARELWWGTTARVKV